MKHELERRSFSFDVRADGNGKRTVSGHAAVFNTLSEPIGGWFREEIAPGAFSDSLAAGDGVYMFWNHNSDIPLAFTGSNTLRLSEDQQGLKFAADLGTDQWGEFALSKIQDGTVRQMSFGFIPIDVAWETRGGEEVRIVKRVKLLEVSPVMFPAYKETSVSARSAESIWREREKAIAEAAARSAAPHGPCLGVLIALNEHRRRIVHGKENG